VIGEARKNKAFRSTIRHSCGCMGGAPRLESRVALLHAAAPEDECDGNVANSPINPAGQALLYDRWSAASLVPRWRPRACRNRVFRAVDPSRCPGARGCMTDDRGRPCRYPPTSACSPREPSTTSPASRGAVGVPQRAHLALCMPSRAMRHVPCEGTERETLDYDGRIRLGRALHWVFSFMFARAPGYIYSGGEPN
jgi:hypothetical protein